VSPEVSEISLRMAGQVGACGLSLSAGVPGMLAAVDQHAAEVRNALASRRHTGTGPGGGMKDLVADRTGRGPAVHVLLGYARGFIEAAIGRGWLPLPGAAADWESLRLAAICQLMRQAETQRLA
jgi:Family of unknown function (DUF6401)